MNSDVKYQTKSLILSSIIISLGMFFSAYYFKNNPNSNETVKGVSELKVKSNLSTWQLSISNSGSNLNSLYANLEQNQKFIKSFLINNNFTESEFNLGTISISNSNDNNQLKYQIYNSITITTKDVDKVNKVSSNLKPLIDNNVLISGSYINYYYTDISSIKNELLDLSINNSKISAKLMADKINKKVGNVKSLNQGVITINSLDGSQINDTNSIYKNVRMVSTVIYELK